MATVDQLRKVGLRESWVVGTQDSVNAYLRKQIAIINRNLSLGTVRGVERKELNARLANLNSELRANFKTFQTNFTEEADALALIDAQTEASTIQLAVGSGVAVTTPTARRVNAANKAVLFTDYAKEATLSASEMSKKLSQSNISSINSIIRNGYIQGLSNQEITKELVGVRVRPSDGSTPYYTGGFTGTAHKRDVDATVRTITRKMSENARQATWEENSDLIEGVEFVATLDNRTTILCGSLDGTVWDIDDSTRPTPPLHWNCRSTTIPKIKGVDLEQSRVARDAKQQTAKDDRSEKVSAKKSRTSRTEVPAGTNYDDFLRGNYKGGEAQPKWFIEDVFGKERAKLYIDNTDMKASDMLKSGEKIPLKELEKKYTRAER